MLYTDSIRMLYTRLNAHAIVPLGLWWVGAHGVDADLGGISVVGGMQVVGGVGHGRGAAKVVVGCESSRGLGRGGRCRVQT